MQNISLVSSLRSRTYGSALVAWPEGIRNALTGLLVGAKIRVGHLDELPFRTIGQLLYTYPIPTKGVRHDVERNLTPAEVLGLYAEPFQLDRRARCSTSR